VDGGESICEKGEILPLNPTKGGGLDFRGLVSKKCRNHPTDPGGGSGKEKGGGKAGSTIEKGRFGVKMEDLENKR